MTLHISNVKYNVLGMATEKCLGYISNLNRSSLNVLENNKKLVHFSVLTSSNFVLTRCKYKRVTVKSTVTCHSKT